MTKKSALIYGALTTVMIAIVWYAVEGSLWSTGDASNRIIHLDGPLIVKPTPVSIEEANIKDDSPVVGIVHKGKARAYVLTSFSEKTQHVVNDVVADKAFTLAYCDVNDCVKVYTNSEGADPLNVTVGGWIGTNLHGSLLLRVGDTLYNQDTGRSISSGKLFPYLTADFERMTWKEWKSKHPDTDVYYNQAKKKQSSSVPNI